MWLYLNFQARFHFHPENGFDKTLLFGITGVAKTLENLIRQAENYTSIFFCNSYRNMALEATASVQEFFTDVGLYLFGADVHPEEFVNRFFDGLFPLVYNHLISPGVTDSSLEYSECIRMARRDVSPFGNIPQRVMGQMGRSLLPSRTFLQALNLGIEVINTTDHLHFSRECSRAVLRMQYCPHCQGLTLSKPCMGYCLNVMRGCLAHMAELNPHWHAYIRSLGELSDAMHGTYDIEHVLLNFHLLVNDAVMQAHLDAQKLSEQISKICGRPIRTPTQSPRCSFEGSKEKHGMKISPRNGEETLANRRKEFINSLRLYRTFYGGLADELCVNELAAADGLPCWDGEHIVKSSGSVCQQPPAGTFSTRLPPGSECMCCSQTPSPGPSHEVMTEVHGAASLPTGGINFLLQSVPHCFLVGSEEVNPTSRPHSCITFILAPSWIPHSPLPDSTFSSRSLQQESPPEEPD
ncbi:glypican-5-like [Prionailurus bengalensis]|uniref:glypican-5-like n=1 Tax=Prionailurus bengalensis TaxID=37029 RepID=UPI001CA80166|nr:glypican-5-like [Prionailurus bengalensis]